MCGRHVSYRSYGAVDGQPVIALHGTPGSHLKFAAADGTATALGLRLIALDRWAYGRSDAPRDLALAAYGADVAAVADALGLGRFAVVGISGGGPFAAAVAAKLGTRVTAVALVSPVGPIVGLNPRPYLRPFHRFAFGVLPYVPGVIPVMFSLLGGMAAKAPSLATRMAAGVAQAGDRAIVRDPAFALSLGETFAVGLEKSALGPMIDMKLFGRPWHVELAAVTAPTRIWFGDEDRNVPLAAVAALAREISQGPAPLEVTELTGHGHFWIARNHDQVLGWIAQMATAAV
jgi:pimeloyl-ACP methyl ester carboxylesterase